MIQSRKQGPGKPKWGEGELGRRPYWATMCEEVLVKLRLQPAVCSAGPLTGSDVVLIMDTDVPAVDDHLCFLW